MKTKLLNALFLTLEIIGKTPWLNYASVVGKWELRSMNLIWGYLALLRAAFGGKSLYYISFNFPFLKEKKKTKNIWIWLFVNSWRVIHVICHPFWKTTILLFPLPYVVVKRITYNCSIWSEQYHLTPFISQ